MFMEHELSSVTCAILHLNVQVVLTDILSYCIPTSKNTNAITAALKNNLKHNMVVHLKTHERQASYAFICEFQDGGTELFQMGDVACTIRCKTERDMEWHIERNHTVDGIASKLQSEAKLAHFLDMNGIVHDRDWLNNIQFKSCPGIEGNKSSARPDFFLPVESARLGCLVFIENDEFGHRTEACDFQRVFNVTTALENTLEHFGVPLLLIRFNPHHFRKDGEPCSRPLHEAHEVMLRTLRSITKVNTGVNLVFIQYDSTNGVPDVFQQDDNNNYAALYRDCLLLNVS